jgi:hypothetical protein
MAPRVCSGLPKSAEVGPLAGEVPVNNPLAAWNDSAVHRGERVHERRKDGQIAKIGAARVAAAAWLASPIRLDRGDPGGGVAGAARRRGRGRA